MTIGEDTLYLSVRELAKLIEARKLSPVELTEAYLRRSETLGRQLNAYVTITRERALAEAREAEHEIDAGKYRGLLHGIPYAAKDLLAAKGYPTTWGAKPFANQVFDRDANVIRRLKDAGAILICKAAMIELAGGMGYRYGTASLTGGAKNPWNTTCWTCGSSSGSGAIVSAALAAFAIGSETWGSILCPSTYAGIAGMRPTFGLVGRSGAMALSYSMDKIGPMARTAEDCAIVLAAIAGHDLDDKGSLRDAKFTPAAAETTLRLGYVNAFPDAKPDIVKNTNAALAVLRAAGHSIAEVKLPEGPWEVAAGVTIQAECATAFDTLIASGRVQELSDPGSRIGGYINETVNAADYLRAQRLRGILQRKMAELLAPYDALVAASLPMAATPLEANLEEVFNFSDPLGGIGNFCGLPAITVPSGLTSDGLPTGIQFVGRAFGDADVIRAAMSYTRSARPSSPHTTRRPPV
ncbi:MAG TPA: amidase [Thermoanaerobaculia bacterium]|jgi:aspartyl-tRNA(Asn)/glutamyl-tRNA(Gln) amidotransferase subunit A